tara:strand:+ start:7625 stop:7927 length:303 start_codon:yes stop_codon:yes gene_type:complete
MYSPLSKLLQDYRDKKTDHWETHNKILTLFSTTKPNQGIEIGDYVYLKTDVDQYKRIVTGYTVRDNSEKVVYLLSLGTEETSHYKCEISMEEDVVLKTTN